MTRFGSGISCSRSGGASAAQSVSPTCTSFSFISPMISPAPASGTSTVRLPSMRKTCCTVSLWPVRGLMTMLPCFTAPEKMRQAVSRPTK